MIDAANGVVVFAMAIGALFGFGLALVFPVPEKRGKPFNVVGKIFCLVAILSAIVLMLYVNQVLNLYRPF